MSRRICNMAILALLALTLSCGSPPYVRVHVSALTGAPDIGQLQVRVEIDSGSSAFNVPNAVSPTALPLPHTFTIELPGNTSGRVKINVSGQMRDANNAEISGATSVNVTGGGAYEAFVVLEAGDATQARLSIDPTEYDFGSVAIGKDSVVSFVLSNTGGMASGIPFVSTDSSGNFQQTSNCTAPLEPGQSCAIKVSFAPLSEGTQTDMLHISANPGNAIDVAIYGTGFTSTACGQMDEPCCMPPLSVCAKSLACQDNICIPTK